MTLDLKELRRQRETGAPGPWEWWTSNSYLRLKVGAGRNHGDNVIEGVALDDGHCDLVVSKDDMARIARVPELEVALLAAEELAQAVQDYSNHEEQAAEFADTGHLSDAHEEYGKAFDAWARVFAALATYRKEVQGDG